MKKLFQLIVLIILVASAQAQDKFFTKTGKINFSATAPNSPENVEGINRNTTCVLDSKTGALQFALLLKGFEFERALMQEHFNENYVESDKFPRAEFKGMVVNNASVTYNKDGAYPVKVKGKLSLHGETKEVETDCTLTIKGGKVNATAKFDVLLADFKVSIPALVADKVSKTANISVVCLLEPLK